MFTIIRNIIRNMFASNATYIDMRDARVMRATFTKYERLFNLDYNPQHYRKI